MFCSNCGAESKGNFCSECGTRLKDSENLENVADQDWAHEVRYEKLSSIEEVRDKIHRYAASSKSVLSAERFMALFDKVNPTGVPVEVIAAIARPISEKLGTQCGKEHSECLSRPPGEVIVATLCSFAAHGQILQQVGQFDNGCLLRATLPSDVWALEGILEVTVSEITDGTLVDGVIKIKGQLFDWGKSQRCLDKLFADLKVI